MDLSKAFDSMPHGLLIAQLSAYGVSKKTCNLIIKYLCNRRQRTKVMGNDSEWVTININFSAFLLTGLAGFLYLSRLSEILSHLLIVLKY